MKTESIELLVGRNVERIATDYTGGRTGLVVAVDKDAQRAQVNWRFEKSGALVNGREKGLTTWVRISQLKLI